MELRQIEHFLAVVEEGSITAAASKLHLVQSSLSSSIQALERELGSPLFARSRRGTTLTDAGRALLPEAQAVRRGTQAARDAVAGVLGLVRGTARIATVALPRSIDPLDVLEPFRRVHPGVRVHVLHDGARDMLDSVRDGSSDWAVTPLTDNHAGVDFEPLLSTPMVLICPAGHRLSGSTATPDALAREPLLDLPQGWWLRHLMDAWFSGAGVQRDITIEINEWFGLLTMIERGIGLGYGPQACIDVTSHPDLRVVPLQDAPVWRVGIVTQHPPALDAAPRALLTAYRDHCARATDGRSAAGSSDGG